jgi:hypothetical protein
MKTQSFPISDKPSPETLQRNLEDLFQFAHTHDIRTTAPSNTEGAIGDIVPVLLSGVGYVYIKFPDIGWKRIQAS